MSRVPGFGIAPPRAPALAAVSNAFAIDATEPAVATGAAFSSFSAATPSAAGVMTSYTSRWHPRVAPSPSPSPSPSRGAADAAVGGVAAASRPRAVCDAATSRAIAATSTSGRRIVECSSRRSFLSAATKRSDMIKEPERATRFPTPCRLFAELFIARRKISRVTRDRTRAHASWRSRSSAPRATGSRRAS
eukprot:30738-Pelagococcus_subviridis.AAC.9